MKYDDRPEEAKRLTKARVSAGLKTAKEAALRFGWKVPTYIQHESGDRGFRLKSGEYAKAFRVTESWLLTGEGEAPETPKVPVLGYAAGSITGFNIIQNDAIDYFKRPPALEDIEDAYALYVRGSSMEPQFCEGDLCFVHPYRQPRAGDAIIIQQSNKREPPIAFIKTFVRRTHTHLIASQHNPKAEIQYPLDTILNVHKVMAMRELFGA